MKWNIISLWFVVVTLSIILIDTQKRISNLEVFEAEATALMEKYTQGFGEVEEILSSLIESIKEIRGQSTAPTVSEYTEPEYPRDGLWLYAPEMGEWVGYWNI